MFAERLKQLRRQRNISQQMLSIQLGVNQTTISGWEIANREPSYEMLARIADLFGVSADYLIGRCESPLGMSPSHTPYIEATVHEQALVRAYPARLPGHPRRGGCGAERSAAAGEQLTLDRMLRQPLYWYKDEVYVCRAGRTVARRACIDSVPTCFALAVPCCCSCCLQA